MIEFICLVLTSIMILIFYYLKRYLNNNTFINFILKDKESLYDYLKLGISPIILFSIVEKIKLINNEFVLSIKGISLIAFIIFYLSIYYLIKLFIKKDKTIIKLSLLLLSNIISYFTSFLLLNIINLPFIIKMLGFISYLLIILSYFIINKVKPTKFIFKNPKPELND